MEKISQYYPLISILSTLAMIALSFVSIKLWLKLRATKKELVAINEGYNSLVKDHSELREWEALTKGKVPGWEEALAKVDKYEAYDSELEEKDKLLKSLNEKINNESQLYNDLREQVGELKHYVELEETGVFTYKFRFQDIKKYEQAFEALKQTLKSYSKDGLAFDDSKSTLKGSPIIKALEKLAMRSFNGNADLISEKVKYNNFDSCQKKLEKTFEFINTQLTPFKCKITDKYYKAKVKELVLAFEYEEEKQRIKEEQDEIRAQMREEQKAIQEAEKKRDKAIEDEERIEESLEVARKEILSKSEAEKEEFENRIKELEDQLREAHENTERAISNSQITNVGHVYIISNLGSFGESIFKIGMTRRDEPMDRVKELGDASVPFRFDVHAMVFSENARTLEADLHNYFDNRRVNRINRRKEFFNVSLEEIEKACEELGYEISLTKLAEAREFREGLEVGSEAA